MDKSKNFCIWHTGRCGSTVLSSMLNQYPQMHSAGELLEMYSRFFKGLKYKPGAWIGGKLCVRYAILKNNAEFFGFEMKVWHLFNLGVTVNQAMNFLQEININKHIILERQNYLRILVSSNVSKKTSSWHIGSERKPTLTKVYVNPEGLAYAIQEFSNFYEKLNRLLGQNCLRLSYEKDIKHNPKIAFHKVADFLELNNLEPDVPLGVTNPYPLQEMILNFDEISNQLKGTKNEWMLEK